MAKRFTDSDKFSDSWFRRLSPVHKLAWLYALDNCDAAGVIDADEELASFQIGEKISWGEFVKACDGRIEDIGRGKFWIVGFIDFQYGARLSEACAAHKPVFLSLAKHGLTKRVTEPLANPSKEGLQVTDTDTDKVPKEGGAGETKPKSPPKIPAFELPASIATAEMQETVEHWLTYKAERRESYKPAALKSLISRIANVAAMHGAADTIRRIERAMANGWVGWDHDSPQQRGSPNDPRGNLALRDRLKAKNREPDPCPQIASSTQ